MLVFVFVQEPVCIPPASPGLGITKSLEDFGASLASLMETKVRHYADVVDRVKHSESRQALLQPNPPPIMSERHTTSRVAANDEMVYEVKKCSTETQGKGIQHSLLQPDAPGSTDAAMQTQHQMGSNAPPTKLSTPPSTSDLVKILIPPTKEGYEARVRLIHMDEWIPWGPRSMETLLCVLIATLSIFLGTCRPTAPFHQTQSLDYNNLM